MNVKVLIKSQATTLLCTSAFLQQTLCYIHHSDLKGFFYLVKTAVFCCPGSHHLSSFLAAGYPDPEVVWLCGDQPVEESSTVQIEYEDDGSCTLILSKVVPEDTNVYTCKATNDHGEMLCSAKLTVLH